MSHLDINYLELFSVLSNLFLLIGFVTAIRWRRILAAFILFVECWVSLIYHVCKFSNNCLLPFNTLKGLDFFFAEYFIIYLSIYLIHFPISWTWLEWVLLLSGAVVIAILQFVLPGELIVQAIVVVGMLSIVIIYWVIYYNTIGNYSLPPYDWICLGIGFALVSISVMMFSVQNIFPSLYWAAHSIWHASAGLGFHFILMIKKPAPKGINIAERIKFT